MLWLEFKISMHEKLGPTQAETPGREGTSSYGSAEALQCHVDSTIGGGHIGFCLSCKALYPIVWGHHRQDSGSAREPVKFPERRKPQGHAHQSLHTLISCGCEPLLWK